MPHGENFYGLTATPGSGAEIASSWLDRSAVVGEMRSLYRAVPFWFSICNRSKNGLRCGRCRQQRSHFAINSYCPVHPIRCLALLYHTLRMRPPCQQAGILTTNEITPEEVRHLTLISRSRHILTWIVWRERCQFQRQFCSGNYRRNVHSLQMANRRWLPNPKPVRSTQGRGMLLLCQVSSYCDRVLSC